MTIDQKIAAKALQLVGPIRQGDQPLPSETEYRSICEGLPVLLRVAGADRALAFLRARKGKDETMPTAEGMVADHLQQQFQNLGLLDGSSRADLQKLFAEAPLSQHRVYARLAMTAALWHKRVAQARLRQKPKASQP
jgi:CRISPR type III-B/RAMP module-associated protein Cmr5